MAKLKGTGLKKYLEEDLSARMLQIRLCLTKLSMERRVRKHNTEVLQREVEILKQDVAQRSQECQRRTKQCFRREQIRP